MQDPDYVGVSTEILPAGGIKPETRWVCCFTPYNIKRLTGIGMKAKFNKSINTVNSNNNLQQQLPE